MTEAESENIQAELKHRNEELKRQTRRAFQAGLAFAVLPYFSCCALLAHGPGCLPLVALMGIVGGFVAAAFLLRGQ